ncbi:succinyldiaminopimelate desuccinylase [Octadecabacter temperatus]|uniref:Succinyl-diaminopimelate desuccinylase n=1 Tax=Octadecabacter temperatus TaxID=1458307 RepID=A0A0K0Y130_9RHOB|nr:succinyl-diaminopimelate desuccinylase [Octadecabacter temperatus]AKS44644.1 Succinyl-diaminopimelate desuccinylase [Octadecabacter temperatus]SIO37063.1 succinyldiaminopimelate desuccinylase [Octadecabacter temperatus]
MPVDPIALTADLIRCPSVTPIEGGALQLLDALLSDAGFETTRIDRNGTPNLFARWGARGANKSFGFNGHTDVVPVGDEAAWTVDPFGAEVRDGIMYGRGATDMKSGVAAFAAAAIDFVKDTPPDGAIILTITGDEEGPSTDGTIALLDWMQSNNEAMTACIVGEPTCPNAMGEMIKVGRRGSLTSHFTVTGKQGHSAYPHRAINPMPAMARLVDRLATHEMDKGSDHFDASTLAVVTIDTGNPATNVIPASCKASANVRFNDLHTSADVIGWMQSEVDVVAAEFGVQIDMNTRVSGESFLTPPGELSDLVSAAVQTETGVTPELSTTGGTSDARFVKNHCPVVEVGLVGKTMHQVDECVPVEQITQLKAIYSRVLRDYFA